MLWKKASKLKPSEFKRKTGFRLNTFKAIVSVVDDFKSKKREKDKRGDHSDFSTEDEVLIML